MSKEASKKFLDNPKQLKKYAAGGLIFILTIFLIYASWDFQGAIFAALILYTLFRPLQDRFVRSGKIGPTLSAIFVMTISVFVILIPLVATGTVVTSAINKGLSDIKSGEFDNFLNEWLDKDKEIFSGLTVGDAVQEIDIKQTVDKIVSAGQDFLLNLAGSISNFGLQLFVTYFILYYLLKYHTSLTKFMYDISPFKKRNTKELLGEFHNMTFSNVVGSGVNALIQGTVLGIGLWIFGISSPVFWGFIGVILSFIPVIGAFLIWFPAGIYLLINGQYGEGIGLLLWGSLLVSTIDNVVRMFVNKRVGNIHPVVSLMGIIIGIPIFGIMGLVLGPLLLSYFVLLIKMYKDEYIDTD